MKNFTLILFLFVASTLSAQNKLSAYEYWFNNDYANAQVVNFTPATQHELNTPIDASTLNDGVNVFNIRYIDENNYYSSTLSKIFYKNTQTAFTNKKLVAYEYWFNNDYSNAQVVNFTPSTQHELNAPIDASTLNDGINVFNIRYKDENNYHSSTLSKIFYKNTQTAFTNKKLVAYEYWFNNDYNNAQVVNFTPATQHELNTPIDASTLNDGVNVFNIRYIDENNYYSSTLSKMFYKKEDQIVNNKIFGYHYWFDNDFTNRIYVSLATPATSVQVLDSINLHQITKGTHTFHFQFHDSVNVWSIVTTDTIQKLPFPIANFSYNDVVNCDSTVINFNDLSIDGDTYLWNFGNGNYDSTANPTHTYYLPGIYTVMLTVTDSASQLDSTYQQIITIIGNTSDSIVETACNNYTSPSGNYQYVTSGIYKDTIPNQYACDSIITINLTINTVDTSVSANDPVLTSNASGATYQWVDCNNNYSFITGQTNQTFTATTNGSYAVIVTQNGCTDTSACYSITSIGIEENTFAEIKVYPNPTKGLINIDFDNISNIQMISIANAVGQEVYHSPIISKKNMVINLDTQKGLYFITIYYKNGAYNVYKLIKQ